MVYVKSEMLGVLAIFPLFSVLVMTKPCRCDTSAKEVKIPGVHHIFYISMS